MKRTFVLVALLATSISGTAVASIPTFSNGALVARKLEAHFNNTDYKARLAKSGGKLTRRVLCAYEKPAVTCSGEMRASGLRVAANWKLRKVSSIRARLSWVFSAAGVPTRGTMLISPRELALRRF